MSANRSVPEKRGFPALLLMVLFTATGCHAMQLPSSAEDIFTGPQLELAQAIERNDMAALRQGAEGVDLHAQGKQQMTLLWFAMMQKNTDAIRTLVELGVHPSEDEMDGMPARTPLGAALMSEDTFYLEAMLEGGLPPDEESERGVPLLYRAVRFGTLNHVKLLVENGADVDAKTSVVGRTAMDVSTTAIKPEISIYLLEQVAEPNIRLENGVTTAWGVHQQIQDLRPGPLRDEFIKLRDMMIERGVEFPPPSPVEVREQMRAEGLTPRVPPGHDY